MTFKYKIIFFLLFNLSISANKENTDQNLEKNNEDSHLEFSISTLNTKEKKQIFFTYKILETLPLYYSTSFNIQQFQAWQAHLSEIKSNARFAATREVNRMINHHIAQFSKNAYQTTNQEFINELILTIFIRKRSKFSPLTSSQKKLFNEAKLRINYFMFKPVKIHSSSKFVFEFYFRKNGSDEDHSNKGVYVCYTEGQMETIIEQLMEFNIKERVIKKESLGWADGLLFVIMGVILFFLVRDHLKENKNENEEAFIRELKNTIKSKNTPEEQKKEVSKLFSKQLQMLNYVSAFTKKDHQAANTFIMNMFRENIELEGKDYILLCHGPAGTGKTQLIYSIFRDVAAKIYLNKNEKKHNIKKYDEIISKTIIGTDFATKELSGSHLKAWDNIINPIEKEAKKNPNKLYFLVINEVDDLISKRSLNSENGKHEAKLVLNMLGRIDKYVTEKNYSNIRILMSCNLTKDQIDDSSYRRTTPMSCTIVPTKTNISNIIKNLCFTYFTKPGKNVFLQLVYKKIFSEEKIKIYTKSISQKYKKDFKEILNQCKRKNMEVAEDFLEKMERIMSPATKKYTEILEAEGIRDQQVKAASHSLEHVESTLDIFADEDLSPKLLPIVQALQGFFYLNIPNLIRNFDDLVSTFDQTLNPKKEKEVDQFDIAEFGINNETKFMTDQQDAEDYSVDIEGKTWYLKQELVKRFDKIQEDFEKNFTLEAEEEE